LINITPFAEKNSLKSNIEIDLYCTIETAIKSNNTSKDSGYRTEQRGDNAPAPDGDARISASSPAFS